MSDFQLGQRVTYTEHIERRNARPGEFGHDKPDVIWSNEAYPGKRFEGGEGVIVGKRTLSEGKVEYNYEDPAIYTPIRHFTAYQIAFDLRRKPVHVLPEHIKPQLASA